MPATTELRAEVLAQIALIQSMVVHLPDETSVFSFVCQGLKDIPGVTQVMHHSGKEDRRTESASSFLSMAIGKEDSGYGALLFTIDDPELFANYAPYVHNLCQMLSVILDERRQRRLIQTHEQDLEQQVADRTKELEHSAKLAALGQLAAGVVHEINNPLGFIRSNVGTINTYMGNLMSVLHAYEKAQLSLGATNKAAFAAVNELKDKFDLYYVLEDARAALKDTMSGLDRISAIVLDIKGFARVGDGKFRTVDFNEVIDSTLNIVWNELKYRCEVSKAYTELPDVECVPEQIGQVALNLFMNAAHAIGDKGRITVRTEHVGDGVSFYVEDDGKGIESQHLDFIFQPFFTTKKSGEGIGLGLSVSNGIVEKHGGKIEVESKLGRGTTFRVWIPLRQSGAERLA